jgi:hypothetical protein
MLCKNGDRLLSAVGAAVSQDTSETEAVSSDAPSVSPGRRPYARLLVALVVAVGVLAAAVVALVVLIAIRTTPVAPMTGPAKTVNVTVTTAGSYGVASVTTPAGTETVAVGANGATQSWRPVLKFGETLTVTVAMTSISADDDLATSAVGCAIAPTDGGAKITSSTSVQNTQVQCIWTNDGKS